MPRRVNKTGSEDADRLRQLRAEVEAIVKRLPGTPEVQGWREHTLTVVCWALDDLAGSVRDDTPPVQSYDKLYRKQR